MRILVAGGAGFIGSNFIRYILGAHDDWSVVNVDKLTYAGNLANLADVAGDPRYGFHRADICDPAGVARIFEEEKPGAVVNFAAETHVDRSIDDPALFLRTNILGTQVLLDAARKAKVARYLQISTDEVYGSLGATGHFSEESPLSPNSPYAASKTSADLLVRAYGKTFGLPVLVTRCSNNYGPYQFPEKLIPFFVTLLHEGKPVPVYGDGMNVRDWIHVEDHSRAVEAVLQRGRPGEIYNVGGERADEHRDHEAADRRDGEGRAVDEIRPRPAGARPAVRDRRREDPGRAGRRTAGSVRGGAARHGAVVHRQRTVVADGPVRRIPVVLRPLVRP